MALFVLPFGVLDGSLKDRLSTLQYRALWKAFREDVHLRTIRVGNLTRQLFDDLDRTELAEALVETDARLAGQIAGIEFERFVKLLAQREPKIEKDSRIRMLITSVCEKYRRGIQSDWQDAYNTRNKLVHERNPSVRKEPRQQNLWVSSGSGRSPSA